MRYGLERGDLRMRREGDRPQARSPAKFPITHNREVHDAESETPPQQSPPRQAARARFPDGSVALRVPELSRIEDAAPRLPPLRTLQGQGSHRHQARIMVPPGEPGDFMKIAVDAMGGDHAPEVTVDGALAALRELGLSTILVGKSAPIEALLKKRNGKVPPEIEIVEAPDVI